MWLVLLVFAAAPVVPQSSEKQIPDNWQTFAESTDYKRSSTYDEAIGFSKKLAAASDLITYRSFGKSSEGRELPLLIVSKDKVFDPESARKSGKAIVFVQAAIHSGESDGKDAGFALLRDIAILKTRIDLLENTIILFVPIYNVDGHELRSKFNRINQNGPEEMGFRANSANQNLNRDYIKSDTPETVAWLGLWNNWDPDFFVDCHVTDGADFRYNVTYEFAHHAESPPQLVNWMNEHFEKNVVPRVESEGNLLSHYLQLADGGDPTKGIYSFIATPRFATGYTPLRNRNGLLIETHSLKDYRSRVRGTYDVLRYTIEEIGENKDSLQKANRDSDRDTIERGKTYDPNRKFPLSQRIGDKSRPFNFKGVEIQFEESEVSGGKRIVYGTKPYDVTIPQYDSAYISAFAAPPLYYIVPPQWIEVIKRLEYHGVEFTRLKEPRVFEIENYMFESQKWATVPFEGRITLSAKSIPVKESRMFPKNSVVVPLDQVNANIAIHWLEPDGPDSAMFWGFFNAIFEQKEYSESYIMEDIAREMLEKDEKLRAEFNEMLKDEKFAKNPRARLNFFYRRSPYYDQRIGVYPVGRITKPTKF
ncbi:MAG: peptidase M14 [Acidobacteria bacterium]|nr:peptidase M14 [Acidobacteriota bacterium]